MDNFTINMTPVIILRLEQGNPQSGFAVFSTKNIYSGKESRTLLGNLFADPHEREVIKRRIFTPPGNGDNSMLVDMYILSRCADYQNFLLVAEISHGEETVIDIKNCSSAKSFMEICKGKPMEDVPQILELSSSEEDDDGADNEPDNQVSQNDKQVSFYN